MHRNPIWLGFLIIFTGITLWYGGDALYKLSVYQKLSAQTPISQITLEVVEKGYGRYAYKAHYIFEVDGIRYENEELLSEPLYRNEIAAKEKASLYEKDPRTVAYNPLNPNYSTLQKNYPYKELFYAIAMTGLLCYFFWLGFSLKEKNTSWKRSLSKTKPPTDPN